MRGDTAVDVANPITTSDEHLDVPEETQPRRRNSVSSNRKSFYDQFQDDPSDTPFRSREHSVAAIADELGNKGCCQCFENKLSGNVKSLMITFLLFTSITSAQVVGALIAGSQALLMDCVSMGVDSITYLVNIYAECNPNMKNPKRDRLLASFVSIVVLIVVTATFIKEAIETIQAGGGGDDDNVDGDRMAIIVFAFAVVGLIFDIVSLVSYCCLTDTNKKQDKTEPLLDGADVIVSNGDELVSATTADARSAKLNMVSALLHVFSDFLRSTTTLVESILLFTWNIDPVLIDAWSSLIVSGLILIGACGTLFAWIIEVRDYCKHGEGENAM